MRLKMTYIHKTLCTILVFALTAGAVALAANDAQTVKMDTAVKVAKKEFRTEDLPVCSISDWNLTLVNPWNEIPEDYEITLTKLSGGHLVDKRCADDLTQMLTDCREADLNPVICSAYRTREKQTQLFNNKVNRLIAAGYSKNTAKTEAAKVVAVPGTSEHQLGLAVDIVDIYNQNLNSSQAKTETQKWLMQNSWKYGFILRYQEDKTEITGIEYEPWHYRYVGKEAAEYIYKNDLCLEEYLELIK